MAAKCYFCATKASRIKDTEVNRACCYVILNSIQPVAPCCVNCKKDVLHNLIYFTEDLETLESLYDRTIFKRKQDAELQLITNKLLGE